MIGQLLCRLIKTGGPGHKGSHGPLHPWLALGPLEPWGLPAGSPGTWSLLSSIIYFFITFAFSVIIRQSTSISIVSFSTSMVTTNNNNLIIISSILEAGGSTLSCKSPISSWSASTTAYPKGVVKCPSSTKYHLPGDAKFEISF